MTQPTHYNRAYSFTGYQASNPAKPLPADKVDAELDGIATTLSGVLGNLLLIQRDDGKLADGCITADAVSAELLEEITGTDGVSPPVPNFTFSAHTVAPGGAATVTVTGSYPNLAVDLGLPRGQPAAPGEATLPDADYGDVLISGSGTHMKVETVLDGQTPATSAALTSGLAGKFDKAGGSITGAVTITNGGLVATGNSTFNNDLGVSGNLTLNTNATRLLFKDAAGSTPYFICQADNNFVFNGTDASGAPRGIWSVFMRSNSSVLVFNSTPAAPTATAGDNSTKLATTAFVTNAVAGLQPAGSYATTGQLATKADALTTVTDFDQDIVAQDSYNGLCMRHIGGTLRTASFGNVTPGVALILVNRSTANTTIACPGGYSKNGGATATANLTLAPGGKLTAFHEGGGYWTFDGTGF